LILIIGITLNLLCIGYFKYANFFIENYNSVTGGNLITENIILPIGISFFTFQQIAFLVDTYQNKTCEYNLLNYCLFISFFPQLIAGPIVHHKEMMPQFSDKQTKKINYDNLGAGISIFSIGLLKKIHFADLFANYASPVFHAADHGTDVMFFQAWIATLAYTFQLYFDFSGYTDMAIGIARMFNIHLPINFNSPYKSSNIIAFWRTWHITLSRFLKNYLYIPLGGNQKGSFRRYINLMITMLLGGLWHGASWNFVLWGGLHGAFLTINNLWRSTKIQSLFEPLKIPDRLAASLSILVTFLSVAFAWVLFRAESFGGAIRVYKGLLGINGIHLLVEYLEQFNSFFDIGYALAIHGLQFIQMDMFIDLQGKVLFLVAVIIIWGMPNTHEIFHPDCMGMPESKSPLKNWFSFQFSYRWLAFVSMAFLLSIKFLYRVSEFLYYDF